MSLKLISFFYGKIETKCGEIMIKNLLLLDGNSMLFRAYYATLYTRRMSTSNGIPTNAVYGFIMMLNKALDLIQPDAVLVAWDAGKKTFRHKKYEAYKGTRKPLDDELIVQFPIVREFLDAAGIQRYEVEGYEADDIIGSMAKRCPETTTIILTSDRDLLQLIDPTTHVLLMKKGITDMEMMDESHFEESYGLVPKQIIDLKGLMGDSSDNIPGVCGVGEKTAKKLLNEYETVENVYENIDKIKGKLKEKLEKDKEQALMSKDLATIYTKMDLPFDLESLVFSVHEDSLNDFYKKYEMNSLMSRAKKVEKKDWNMEVVHDWNVEMKEERILIPVCTKDSFIQQELFGFMSAEDSIIYYISAEDALESSAFKSMLTSNILNTWDIKEMKHLLSKYGFPVAKFKEDLHIASFLLHSQATNLDALMDALHVELPESFHDLTKKQKDIPAYEQNRVLAVYKVFTQFLYENKNRILQEIKEEEMDALYRNIELPLVDVLYTMENEGMFIDTTILNQMDQVISEKIDSLSNEIYKLANTVFNINSPKQLSAILFDELNLKSPGKKRSTSADVLEKLKGSHPIIEYLLEYRKFSKIKSTYVEGLRKHIQSDQKIHTTFNQTMTQTGRLSSSDPNLQNISIRDEEGREIRKAFTAPEGYRLVSADYSQIELRMLAHMAHEEHMIQAFQQGTDIHTRTASHIFNIDEIEVQPDQRRIAKTVNFGIVYGQTEFGLSEQLGITRKEAKEFMETYFKSYPKIHSFMNELIAFCQEHGYVETLFHRRRMIPEINDKNYMTREFGKRAAMNAPIQGSAADLIKVAMLKVDAAMKKAEVRSKMLLQIHDELIFLVPEEEMDTMIDLVEKTMNSAMELDVPLKASISSGTSWYEAK